MAAQLARGGRVIQAYYAVQEPGRSWVGSLRYAAFAVLHYLRPLGRMAFGASAGLKGNGMVFSAGVIKELRWSGHLTEDIDLHMALLLSGERVVFAPEAVFWAEMPDNLKKMRSQHTRWERGRIEMVRLYFPKLLKAMVENWKTGERKQASVLFDAILEHLIPPFSVLWGLSMIGFLSAAAAFILIPASSSPVQVVSPLLLVFSRLNLAISAFVLVGQTLYLLSGLFLVRAPASVYMSLLYAPFLVVWKIFHYLRVLFIREHTSWIRTARNES
jgi:1,2-diacylglycerol 3-beta-glucosyltransferase